MRGLIRNLQSWRSGFEAREVGEVLRDPLGREWGLWDVERFYGYRFQLPDRQRSAIELMLYHNRYERDVARIMGISESNPVGVYVTVGLSRLLALARAGQLAGCVFEFDVDLPAPAACEPLPVAVVVPPPRHGRAGHAACECRHSSSLHGQALTVCRATGCRCESWRQVTPALAEAA